MSEQQKLYDTVYGAMLNSYKVLVDNQDPYEMMEDEMPKEVVFAHHLDAPITIENIQHMIVWWEEEEEYEMCAELKHLENEVKRLSSRYKKRRDKHPQD